MPNHRPNPDQEAIDSLPASALRSPAARFAAFGAESYAPGAFDSIFRRRHPFQRSINAAFFDSGDDALGAEPRAICGGSKFPR